MGEDQQETRVLLYVGGAEPVDPATLGDGGEGRGDGEGTPGRKVRSCDVGASDRSETSKSRDGDGRWV